MTLLAVDDTTGERFIAVCHVCELPVVPSLNLFEELEAACTHCSTNTRPPKWVRNVRTEGPGGLAEWAPVGQSLTVLSVLATFTNEGTLDGHEIAARTGLSHATATARASKLVDYGLAYRGDRKRSSKRTGRRVTVGTYGATAEGLLFIEQNGAVT